MTEIKIGETFIHRETGHHYIILNRVQIKAGKGKWLDGIAYTPAYPDLRVGERWFVRTDEEFFRSFARPTEVNHA